VVVDARQRRQHVRRHLIDVDHAHRARALDVRAADAQLTRHVGLFEHEPLRLLARLDGAARGLERVLHPGEPPLVVAADGERMGGRCNPRDEEHRRAHVRDRAVQRRGGDDDEPAPAQHRVDRGGEQP
jgi:hypothetical protein